MQMKQLQMNKKEIGKEIEVLIRSIKLHYDNIAEEVRIPSIELELITAKISKLHDKSIVFNYLHYMEEQLFRLNNVMLDDDQNEDETPEENFKINSSEISTPIVTPHITEKEIFVAETTKPMLVEAETIATEQSIETPVATSENAPVTESKIEDIKIETVPTNSAITMPQANEMVGKDLKKIIGFSDKYYFISQLFGGNADDFNVEVNNLNFCPNLISANAHIDELQQQKKWEIDSEALQSLKRYITTKYN
jgi:hypothetical protein